MRRRACWGVDAAELHVLVVAVDEVDEVAALRSELVFLLVLVLVLGLVSAHGRQVLEHAVRHDGEDAQEARHVPALGRSKAIVSLLDEDVLEPTLHLGGWGGGGGVKGA